MSRLLLLVFSLCLHGGVAGALFLFSSDGKSHEEEVYRVSLADFAPLEAAAPELVQEAPPPVAPPEPVPEPVVSPPEPPKSEEAQVISPKKKPEPPKPKKPKEKPKPPPAEPRAETNTQASGQAAGPRPGNVGGFSAYKQDQVDQRPSISKRISPIYPSQARRMNIEGKVTVQLVVDTSGAPQSCTVSRAEPPGYFEEAALTAARKTRFIPGKLKGQPVNTLVLLPFAFKLR